MLRDVLRRNAVHQGEAAAALGVTQETLSRWSRGHAVPSTVHLVRLLAFLRQMEPDLQAEDLLPPPPAGDARAEAVLRRQAVAEAAVRAAAEALQRAERVRDEAAAAVAAEALLVALSESGAPAGSALDIPEGK